MPSANPISQTARIPAWKRLGLKLKSEHGTTPVEQPQAIDTPKRKRIDSPEATVSSRKAKKTQLVAPTVDNPITPNLVRKKSVTFTPETKIDDGDSIKQLFNSWVTEQKSQDPSFELKTSSQVFDTPEPVQIEEHIDPSIPEKERRVKRVKNPKVANLSKEKIVSKKSKSESKSKKNLKVSNPEKPSPPFLSYLRQYQEDRPNWKFNKNHQTHIIKNIFNLGVIPSDHVHFIYEYVRGLQGGVRTRLRDEAFAVKIKDQEEGAAGFSEIMEADMIKKKQEEYDRACAEYVAHMTQIDASPKMGYEEGVLLGLSDYAMKERVAKRTRAEQILAELGTGGDGAVGGNGTNEPTGVNGDDDSQKRLRMNDGSTQKVARKRKQRTMVEDVDSSSSDDTSDSDTSTSGESESETPARRINYNADDTSSSSSSSSSESGSEEEDEDNSEEDSDESDSDE